MSSHAYRLTTTASSPDVGDSLEVHATLELIDVGRRWYWWLTVRTGQSRMGDFERFPFLCIERPPLDAALHEVKLRISRRLGTTLDKVDYRGGVRWIGDDQ